MREYTYIGEFREWEDIISLFPSGGIKDDEADIVVNYMKDNCGAFDKTGTCTVTYEESYFKNRPDRVYLPTSDGEYFVGFTKGGKDTLLKHLSNHGYHIAVFRKAETELDELYEKAEKLTEELQEVVLRIKELTATAK